MDLSKKIDLALAKEEMGIPIYHAHIKNSLFWAPFDNLTKKRILVGLERLYLDSRGHIKLLKKIKKIEKKYVE